MKKQTQKKIFILFVNFHSGLFINFFFPPMAINWRKEKRHILKMQLNENYCSETLAAIEVLSWLELFLSVLRFLEKITNSWLRRQLINFNQEFLCCSLKDITSNLHLKLFSCFSVFVSVSVPDAHIPTRGAGPRCPLQSLSPSQSRHNHSLQEQASNASLTQGSTASRISFFPVPFGITTTYPPMAAVMCCKAAFVYTHEGLREM